MNLLKDRPFTVAIVGAGYSGLIVACELVRQAKSPFTMLLCDPSPFNDKCGVAFTTDCPLHLLNVPAGKMGAFHENPEGFYEWLLKNPQKWQNLHPTFKNLEVSPNSFLPRMIYGFYLQCVKENMLEEAKKKQILVQWFIENINDIQHGRNGALELFSDSGSCFLCEYVILAIGVPWTHSFVHDGGLDASTGYLSAPWPYLTNISKAHKLLDNSSVNSTIGIVGTGLTMLDALATLKAVNYKGKISVISRRSILPQRYIAALEGSVDLPPIEQFPKTALGIYKKIRSLVEIAQNNGYDWRIVIDALRPMTSQLWAMLPPTEKRKVIRHLFVLWNSHRHRAPKESLDLVHYFKDQNRLQFIRAKALLFEKGKERKVDVIAIDSRTKHHIKLPFDLVVNCSGPDFKLKIHPLLLIHRLIESGMAEPDNVGLGLSVGDDNNLNGKASNNLFAVGPVLFGTYYETTAVKEIRWQGHNVAAAVFKLERKKQ